MLFLEILLGGNAFENYYANLILQQKCIQSCGHHQHFQVQAQMSYPAPLLSITRHMAPLRLWLQLSGGSPRCHFWIFKANLNLKLTHHQNLRRLEPGLEHSSLSTYLSFVLFRFFFQIFFKIKVLNTSKCLHYKSSTVRAALSPMLPLAVPVLL